ncbi:carbonyl reductase [NADPH] 1 [Folsomia candida]|uniref:carbonyl reductase [NADPH] 1 n=1 Tax=Folsomia candida TaxID=158441 RepID=UPI000B8F3002|nr:carbonyl reductase [NADPH] 1 [Folsomia candida]
MSGKVAIVTGSNKGIGFAIVRALCKQFDGDVYLTSRDEGRGVEAVDLLKKEGLSPKFSILDINSSASIAKFKDFIQTTHGGIDVLVNNAGIAFKNNATEPFHVQAEVTNGTNYFATKDFCNAIFPLLRPHARVVNVSSSSGYLKKINGKEPESIELQKRFADVNLTQDELSGMVNKFIELTKTGNHFEHGWPNSTYSVSKVALSSLTRIQQRELDEARPGDDIIVNAVHPGYVDTDMTSHKGPLSPDEGAIAATWLALLPQNATTPRGGYVWHDKTVVDWANGPAPGEY